MVGKGTEHGGTGGGPCWDGQRARRRKVRAEAPGEGREAGLTQSSRPQGPKQVRCTGKAAVSHSLPPTPLGQVWAKGPSRPGHQVQARGAIPYRPIDSSAWVSDG